MARINQVTITHPEIDGVAQIVESSLPVWEAKGWSVVGDEPVVEDQPAFDWSDPDDTVDDPDDDVADE